MSNPEKEDSNQGLSTVEEVSESKENTGDEDVASEDQEEYQPSLMSQEDDTLPVNKEEMSSFAEEEENEEEFQQKYSEILKELETEDDIPLSLSLPAHGGSGGMQLDEMISFLEGEGDSNSNTESAEQEEQQQPQKNKTTSFDTIEVSTKPQQEDNEEKMVILGPDHPKMQRFQAALKAHLLRQIYEVESEMRSQTKELKVKKEERTNLGQALFNLQHDMMSQSKRIDGYDKELAELDEKGKRVQEELDEMKSQHETVKEKLAEEQENEKELMKYLQTLDFSEHIIKETAEKYEGELKVRNLVDEKLQKLKEKTEYEKRTQDFYLDKVLTRVHEMEEINEGILRQIQSHKEEQNEMNAYITEGRTEIEALQIEKLHLQRAWNDTIATVRARDEALKAARDTLKESMEELRIKESELRSLNKVIVKEQENHEMAEMLLKRRRIEEKIVSKQLEKLQIQNEDLRGRLATLNRIRSATEDELLRANNLLHRKRKEIHHPRKQIETLAEERLKLEDAIMTLIQERSAYDKAAAHVSAKLRESRQKTRSMEIEAAKLENNLTKMTVEVESLRGTLLTKTHELEELEKNLAQQDRIILDQIREIKQSDRIIKRKTMEVEALSKKLKRIVESQGGTEMTPLQREIADIEKQISAERAMVVSLQEEWLKRQDELVKLTSKRDSILERNEELKKELFILDKKRLRLETEYEKKKNDMNKLQRANEKLRAEITLANSQLYKDRLNHAQLDKDNQLMCQEMIKMLKDAEMESLELQEEIETLENDKEYLLNTLQEVHEQNLQWEKKIHLAKELKQSLKKDVETTTGSLQLAIHHMKVRHNELMRVQEKLMQDLERSVEKRDTIIQQADNYLKRQNIHPKKTRLNVERSFVQLKDQNRNLAKEVAELEQEVRTMMEDIDKMEKNLQSEHDTLEKAKDAIFDSETKIGEAAVQKHKNLLEIILRQQKYKVLESVKLKRYKPLTKSDSQYQCELEKIETKCHTMVELADALQREFPEAALHARLIKSSVLPTA